MVEHPGPEEVARYLRERGFLRDGRVEFLGRGVFNAGYRAGDLPVVVGGIIPDEDAQKLRAAGVQRVYTPKDFDLTRIMGEVVDVVSESRAAA